MRVSLRADDYLYVFAPFGVPLSERLKHQHDHSRRKGRPRVDLSTTEPGKPYELVKACAPQLDDMVGRLPRLEGDPGTIAQPPAPDSVG
jgi:hypothetical protein